LPPPHHRAASAADSDQRTESPFGWHLNAFIDSIDPQRTSVIASAREFTLLA
jgi:hypothetical protein